MEDRHRIFISTVAVLVDEGEGDSADGTIAATVVEQHFAKAYAEFTTPFESGHVGGIEKIGVAEASKCRVVQRKIRPVQQHDPVCVVVGADADVVQIEPAVAHVDVHAVGGIIPGFECDTAEGELDAGVVDVKTMGFVIPGHNILRR